MSIQTQFEQFCENIAQSVSQREDAKTKYNGVCKKLHDFYYPGVEYTGSTKLLIGSYGKHTNIRPPRDVDVLFIMPYDRFKQYDDYKTNGQSQLLQDIRSILSQKYTTTDKIKGWGKVVLIQFADGTHNIELLPAWEKSDGRFVIPNSEQGGSWEIQDPRLEMWRIDDSDKKTRGETRPLIRMIKKWSENCSVNLKSFQIENEVLDFLGQHTNEDVGFSFLVRDFFAYCCGNGEKEVKSQLETAYGRAKKACVFEVNGDLDDAAEEWKKVFGDDFPCCPDGGARSLSQIYKTPVLADSSHCEPLRWHFQRISSVAVEAHTYTYDKAKRLGGINSDGRTLAHGLYVKFIGRTNTVGTFRYYWQVVNTGMAARLANDLRGNIFEGNQVRWEHTKYPGKHWIECFVVLDNVCVARSGKFFMNIR